MARKERERRGSRRRGNTVSVNWGEAEISNYVTRPGVYAFKVTKAEADDEQIIMDAEVISEGPQEGKVNRTWFNLTPQSLWVLARFLEAIGEEIPDDEADLDLDEWVDKEFVAEVEENEYQDKVRLRIAATSFAPIDEYEAPEEKKGSSKKSSKRDEPEEEEEEEKPAKRGRGRPRKEDKEERTSKRRGRDEPEEDDEPEEKPARGSKGKKGKNLPPVTAEEVEDMSEEELDDLIAKYDLDADISEAKTLRKKCAIVLDELDAKELLEEEKKSRR
jgi:hypothetical protein